MTLTHNPPNRCWADKERDHGPVCVSEVRAPICAYCGGEFDPETGDHKDADQDDHWPTGAPREVGA